MLGKGILKRTVCGNSLLVSLIKPKKEPVFIPSVKDVISILGKPAKERTKDNIFTVSKFFESKKFFAGYVSEGNYDVIDQCSKEMNLEVAEKDKMIIKFGEFGYTFYVVVTGSVGIYIPTKETFSFTYKEYIEFLIPRIRFIASVNGDTNVKLPEFTQIVEKNDEGKINLDHLDDLLSISARNPKYSRDSIMRQMFSKNKNDYEISYFVKVAVLGDGFEFGGDALVNGKPRNATVVAEKTTFLATLQKDQYDEILKKQEQRRIERFIHRLSYFQIANHFSRTYKGKLRKYFFNVEFKRGQILYQEEDKPEDIYFLLEGEIELYKTFNVLKTDEKDTVFYKELQISPFIKTREYDFFKNNMPLIKQFQKNRIPVEDYFKSKYFTRTMIIGRYQPYEIIGVEEVMIEASQRFISARCCSEKAVMFRLKKADLK